MMENKPHIAIIGAGPAGLMCADVLSQYDVRVSVFEQMPSAGRKFLMAGKTGLNLSHAEPLDDFVQRYTPQAWLEPFVRLYDATWIQHWAKSLGIETYVGSSGRIFPVEMKAAPLLRAWLADLKQKGVQFFYHHRCVDIQQNQVKFQNLKNENHQIITYQFDAIVLACGAISYPQLGSTGQWQQWFNADEIMPFYASNVGICRQWSSFMQEHFGQALKRVNAWVDGQPCHGDIVISHYGLESGLIYRINQPLREQLLAKGQMTLHLDLLPDYEKQSIIQILQKNIKLSLNTRLKKLGLNATKIALLRECSDKQHWQDMALMADYIKDLAITFSHFRPIDEAISCGGGIKQESLQHDFQLKSNPYIFCCGEMLDWNAPTGGYLLTACLATGRVCGQRVAEFLSIHS
ncbi:TIGR03862 family flavoprotein [Moraxella sp. ZY210820]|uniref:TIGR03862 family flavoprotein n=1 Tax=unclassified Moraxella TaxID=2685852 RepID=UPI00272F73FA|nr:TIGR03862 family flavoprotein [Moraxella sp. ZY210820]WLF84261.1 TIGR03862 family flavoprotein [Moraxella sp. ZY210820]